MPKINILRRTTCFYPGTIQLPLLTFYPTPNNETSTEEWALTRNFKALNITDYRCQLENVSGVNESIPTNSYSPLKGNILINYKIGEETMARVEISNVREEAARNADRFFLDNAISELILLQYYYGVDLPDDPSKAAISHDFEATASTFKEIVNLYIKGSGDWTIASPHSINAPIYYEAIDIYFDADIPAEEMRQAILLKTDRHWDLFRSQVSVEGLNPTFTAKVIVDLEKSSNNILYLLKNPDNETAKAIELFAAIRRDILINQNYKYALLESFTFAEAFITNYLTDYKVKAGISKTKIDNFEKEIGISYKLNIELPLILGVGDAERGLIGGVESIRKKRNKIIHGQASEETVTKEEALSALRAVQELHKFMFPPK